MKIPHAEVVQFDSPGGGPGYGWWAAACGGSLLWHLRKEEKGGEEGGERRRGRMRGRMRGIMGKKKRNEDRQEEKKEEKKVCIHTADDLHTRYHITHVELVSLLYV